MKNNKGKIIIPPHLAAKVKEEQKTDLAVESTRVFREYTERVFQMLGEEIEKATGSQPTKADSNETECLHIPVAFDSSIRTYFFRGQPIICAIPPRALKEEDGIKIKYVLSRFEQEDPVFQEYALKVYNLYRSIATKKEESEQPQTNP